MDNWLRFHSERIKRRADSSNPRDMDIKAIRRKLGLTQSQLADRLPTTIRTIARWENESINPHQIAKARLQALLDEFERTQSDPPTKRQMSMEDPA